MINKILQSKEVSFAVTTLNYCVLGTAMLFNGFSGNWVGFAGYFLAIMWFSFYLVFTKLLRDQRDEAMTGWKNAVDLLQEIKDITTEIDSKKNGS